MAEVAGGASAQSSSLHPHQLALCGYSGSGKTTLAVKLIEALSPEYRIGYVKHDAHGFQMDTAGKDTYRASGAGAAEVLINDPGRTARITARPIGPFDAPSMLECDWLLVEGYKNSVVPKVLVLDGAGRAEREWLAGGFRNVRACVGGAARAQELPAPYFHRDDVGGLIEWIRAYWWEELRKVPVYGLVLAGGESRRMRRPKWSLEYRGEPHALRLLRLMAEYTERAWISIRSEQGSEAGLEGVPALPDRFLGMGPLGGILTAMHEHPEAAWLVVACDLPHVDDLTFARLIERRAPLRFATTYVSPWDGLPEPLCALYEPKSRVRLLQTLGSGHRCPRAMLVNSRIELLADADATELANANHPHEYEEAARLTAEWPPLEEIAT